MVAGSAASPNMKQCNPFQLSFAVSFSLGFIINSSACIQLEPEPEKCKVNQQNVISNVDCSLHFSSALANST